MGIESDKVVYEYLSRVGDIASQRQLPSSARMRLVSELRNEIDRDRARATVDSPAAVRRILDRLGTPDEVVEAAGGTGSADGAGRPSAAVPAQPVPRAREPKRAAPDEERPRGLRRVVPRPRPTEPRPEPSVPRDAPRAASQELWEAAPAPDPDWWRTADGPFGGGGHSPFLDTDPVPGFVGGVEIPDLLRRPPHEIERERRERAEREEKERAAQAPLPAPARRFGLFPRRAPAAAPALDKAPGLAPDAEAAAPTRRLLPGPAGGWSNPFLLLAAAALIVGAVLGNWFALLAGWAMAYASRRLSPSESKWAVLVLPGTAVAAGLVWLWGRQNGRWGDPIAQGQMNDAVAQTWPWVVRGAAVASALYVLWRSQRKG
ncbi:membrane protein [Streptomyces rochei]|nr:membrane protein [Streptomyces rochei]